MVNYSSEPEVMVMNPVNYLHPICKDLDPICKNKPPWTLRPDEKETKLSEDIIEMKTVKILREIIKDCLDEYPENHTKEIPSVIKNLYNIER